MFARKHLTSPRKIKAALVKRPVAFVIVEVNFHTIIVCTKNNFANCLRWLVVMSYAYPAPYKTGVGICSPKLTKATPDAESVFFVVRYTSHSMAWCTLFNVGSAADITHNGVYHVAHNGAMCLPYAGFTSIFPSTYNSTSRHQRMVTLAGQPQGWPVPFVPGTANPVNVTAPIKICSLGGDSLTRTKEAA
ncbi:hypothetical protein D7O18_15085 [Salmonella enterica subsp. enterica serovar Muenchen]|nr:hypothetical protein [Salmonella enterica subsp. enterica serovar Muenchen]